MARSLPEAILIVLDIGPNVGEELSKNGETFFSNAKLCATQILQRKILAESKDEICLVLLGSEETNNPLSDGVGYTHIDIRYSFQLADWDMVETIASFKNCTSVTGSDWLDALIVSVDFMRSATEGKVFKEKKIVMLTNFCSDVSDDEVAAVIQGLKNEEVQVIAIGPQVYESDSQQQPYMENKSQDQVEGEKLIAKIINEVPNSVICNFEDAIADLALFEMKKTRPTPWNITLDIGTHLNIPVVGYKKIDDVRRKPVYNIVNSYLNKMSTNSRVSGPASLSLPLHDGKIDRMEVGDENDNDDLPAVQDKPFQIVDKDRVYRTVDEDAAPVDEKDIISGFMFGGTLVPVSDDDLPKLMYFSGDKCLSVIGFVQKREIPQCAIKGKKCHFIFPLKQEDCMRAFSALIQAMDGLDMVALCRKVSVKNGLPSIVALHPHITAKYQYFICVELPYSEEMKILLFPPLVTDKLQPSSEQLDIIDQLITKMDLMDEEDEEDKESGAYDPLKTLDPYEQHYLSVVAKKALNKDLYFSGQDIDLAVRNLLSPKEELLEAAKQTLESIKELFPLTENVPKEGARKAAADVFKQDTAINSSDQCLSKQPSVDDTVHIVGSINPQDDFMKLIKSGTPTETACTLLGKVILDLILRAFDTDDLKKPFKCLQFMRQVCLNDNPSIYNEWILGLKKEIPPEKSEFWEFVASDNAGLITVSESKRSNISEEIAKDFLQIDAKEDNTLPLQSVDEDLDDLLNQM